MKVRATQTGYDGIALREEGDVFDIKPEQFSDFWMEKVGGETPVAPITTPKQDEAVKTPEPKAAPVKKPVRSKKDVI